jgi:hypothetical protein
MVGNCCASSTRCLAPPEAIISGRSCAMEPSAPATLPRKLCFSSGLSAYQSTASWRGSTRLRNIQSCAPVWLLARDGACSLSHATPVAATSRLGISAAWAPAWPHMRPADSPKPTSRGCTAAGGLTKPRPAPRRAAAAAPARSPDHRCSRDRTAALRRRVRPARGLLRRRCRGIHHRRVHGAASTTSQRIRRLRLLRHAREHVPHIGGRRGAQRVVHVVADRAVRQHRAAASQVGGSRPGHVAAVVQVVVRELAQRRGAPVRVVAEVVLARHGVPHEGRPA